MKIGDQVRISDAAGGGTGVIASTPIRHANAICYCVKSPRGTFLGLMKETLLKKTEEENHHGKRA